MNRIRIVNLLLISALVLSCAGIRKVTYPQEFHYLEKKDLSSAMWNFAIAVANLNSILSRSPSEDKMQQTEVVAQLKEMEKVAGTLGGSGQMTNHPMIDNHLDLLKEDLATARIAAEKKPPNYYLAGKISGSCQYCHGPSPYPHR